MWVPRSNGAWTWQQCSGIETTAHFDSSMDELVLNSPTISSHKYRIGGLGLVATTIPTTLKLETSPSRNIIPKLPFHEGLGWISSTTRMTINKVWGYLVELSSHTFLNWGRTAGLFWYCEGVYRAAKVQLRLEQATTMFVKYFGKVYSGIYRQHSLIEMVSRIFSLWLLSRPKSRKQD